MFQWTSCPRCSRQRVHLKASPQVFTCKKKVPMSTVEVLTEVGAVALLVLKLIAPCWEQIGPLTKVPFSLFEGIITSLTSLVCNRMACHKHTDTLFSCKNSAYSSTGAAGQAEKEGETEQAPLPGCTDSHPGIDRGLWNTSTNKCCFPQLPVN